MKTVVMTGIAFIASAAAALAADAQPPVVTPGPFQAPPAYPPGQNHWWGPTVVPGPFDPPPAYPGRKFYDWTGFYGGINGGGAFGETDWLALATIPPIPATVGVGSGSTTFSGGLVGATAGYNLQTGDPFVIGMEADFDWADIKGTTPATGVVEACPAGCEVKMSWLATARLRFGYAFWDTVLPYVTGGAAMATLNADAVGKPNGVAAVTNLGWTAGAGVEFVIAGPWRAKVEYLYVDLSGFSCNTECGSFPAVTANGPVEFKVHDNVVRAGLNYRFWMN
jgi:outer membrane immunogenic protein